MNRYNRPALLLGIALVASACAADPGPQGGSPAATPSDTSAMSEPPTTSRAPTASPSVSPTPHDMGGMAGSSQSVAVEILNFAFEPVEVTIASGTEVTFTNADAAPHTVTAGTDGEPMPDVFGSGLLATGESFRFVFDEPGEYAYFCERHPPMTGRIVVEG